MSIAAALAAASAASNSPAELPVFVVKFLPHGHHDKLHVHLNLNYGLPLPSPEHLFVDPASPTELLGDTELLPAIRRSICDDLIAPMAVQTNDKSTIMPLLTAAPFFVDVKKVKHCLTKASLTNSIVEAINNRKPSVEIQIATSHFFIDEASGPITYLGWEKFSTSAVPAPPAPHVLTAAEIAAAVAGAIPAPPSATDLANAVATAYPMAGANPSAAPSATSASPMLSLIFNTRNLPADVLHRYENKQKGGLIIGSTVQAPFTSGHFYHCEGRWNCLCQSSDHFKAMVSCDDDAHAGIRNWYQKFMHACYDYGFYCHPIYCFCPDHGGKRGFSIGDGASDDLPITMNMAISNMAGPLHRLLLKRNTFPPNSRLNSIVNSAENDGFVALKAILFASHPAFCPQPSTLITSYPKQRDCSILEFYKLFIDFTIMVR